MRRVPHHRSSWITTKAHTLQAFCATDWAESHHDIAVVGDGLQLLHRDTAHGRGNTVECQWQTRDPFTVARDIGPTVTEIPWQAYDVAVTAPRSAAPALRRMCSAGGTQQ